MGGLFFISPARTSQTDPAPAQCIEQSIANSDAQGNAPAIAYHGHHWLAYIQSNAAACAGGRGRAASQLCPCAEPSAGTKLLLLECLPQLQTHTCLRLAMASVRGAQIRAKDARFQFRLSLGSHATDHA